LKYSEKEDRHRGDYKKFTNQVEAFDQDGKSMGGVLETAGPFDTPDWMPRILFFLKTMQQQKNRLQIKIEREKLLLGQLPELFLQILKLAKSWGRIRISEIVTLTTANRNTVKKHLESLVEAKQSL
jgi:Fic family protein